jgi:CubicO group peptidase (beta-lactamase class C family)
VSVPDSDALDAVDRLASRFFARGGQPGLAYGVVVGRRLVHFGAHGERVLGGPEPDADTVFRIASMTKSFTAALLLLLRDDGKLALDDPVASYVPELDVVRGPSADAPALTVRHLLTMSGGLPTDDPWGDRQQSLPLEDFRALLRGGLTFAWTPGTAYEYSNLGYAILGLVAAAAGGAAYHELVATRLLTPLGMPATVFEAGQVPADRLATGHQRRDAEWLPVPFDPLGAFAPMGGLFSSVRDLAVWVAGFIDAFPPRDDPEAGHVLDRASRREMQQQHRAIPPSPGWPSLDSPPPPRAGGYGFGLVVESDPGRGDVTSHSGGYPGFGSHMRWHAGSGLGVVVLANSTYALASVLAAGMLDALLRGAGHGRPHRRQGPVPADGRMWPATLAARADVEQLLVNGWDDALAARLFAANVDADEPLPRRRAEVERLRDRLGPLRPDPDSGTRSDSAAHCAWWLRGPTGRLAVQIRLTPQVPPRVQSLILTPVPDPAPKLRDLAAAVVAGINAEPPGWPADRPAPDGCDPASLSRLVRMAAGWAGPCSIGEVLAGDGERESTLRLTGTRAGLILTVGAAGPDRPAVRLRPDADHLPPAWPAVADADAEE